MSNNKMLIDATHPEETRVVVLRNGRVEEFDYESAARKLLRGNIYLAKVTRVEPSLQAAFVDYGGNRHGFLAFNEIHPDYYQIPVADRELLKQEEAEAEAEAEAAAEARAERRAKQQEERRARKSGAKGVMRRGRGKSGAGGKPAVEAEDAAATAGADKPDEQGSPAVAAAAAAVARAMASVSQDKVIQADVVENIDAEPADAPHAIGLVEDQGVHADDEGVATAAAADVDAAVEVPVIDDEVDATAALRDQPADDAAMNAETSDDEAADDDSDHSDDDDDDANGDGSDAEPVEEVGSEDAMEEIAERPRRRAKQYKIQEVIKRRQVLLVQVVKEERGNKGAALTTYLSLAGRYTVLMPNTGRGGGISRKITNAADRKRLKAIANDLDVPEGMGLIIRTAGASRSKEEIQRDFEYLLRLWESVRELTLESSAPNVVYQEGDLIKRSIRDLYTKEIDEIHVAGDEAYAEAREFMAMLMPSHEKNVIRYEAPEPLFAKYQIERQLNAMFSPYVTLKSGGYIVINQTEALVSVDVNSGKSTREFSIEQTALNTNLEAAEELGRQLKLRDLAGLIVIDFIDMEERRNNRAVERKIKECLKNDRARIQVGRISHFGLLEMSRQRMRTGVLEGSTTQCPHCSGTGTIRSTESVALAVLRALEDALIDNSRHSLTAVTTATVGLYILNFKRSFINEMEDRYGVSITIEASDRMQGANFSIEKAAAPPQPKRRNENVAVNMESGFTAIEAEGQPGGAAARDEDGDGKKSRRRRRRGGRKNKTDAGAESGASARGGEANGGGAEAGQPSRDEARAEGGNAELNGAVVEGAAEAAGGEGSGEDRPKRSRRRGRRGGRRNKDRDQTGVTPDSDGETTAGASDNGGEAAIPGSGEQPDLGDLPALHGAAPKALPADADTGSNVDAAGGKSERGNGKPRRGRRSASGTGGGGREKSADAVDVAAGSSSGDADTASEKAAPAAKPIAEDAPPPPAAAPTPEPVPVAAKEPEPAAKPARRKGWWQRAFSSD